MARAILSRRILSAAARMAAHAPTPFYLFDAARLAVDARAWQAAAAENGRIGLFYPYKCNRAAEVVGAIARAGLKAEVTSLADFSLARAASLSADEMVVQGPAKARALLDKGLSGNALFVADGREDLLALFARARALRRAPRYLLRLAPLAAEDSQGSFGLPGRELVRLAREVLRAGQTPWLGLAFHLGTGISSLRPYRLAIREAGEIAEELRSIGAGVRFLDVGGGFASRVESRLDSRGRARGLGKPPREILSNLFAEARARFPLGVRMLAEPGRAVVSGSLHLVAQVLAVKEARGRRRVFLDASRLAHAFFVARGRHEIAVVPDRARGKRRWAELAGPLGVELDLFSDRAPIGQARAGDLVVIGSVGAYNTNAASAWAGRVPPIARMVFSGREERWPSPRN